MGPYYRKYNTATDSAHHICIPLLNADGKDYNSSWVPVAGDVKVNKNGGGQVNIATLPTYVGGRWQFIFSAAETQAKKIEVNIVDSATKVILDDGFTIETFGNANAMHLINPEDGVAFGMSRLDATITSRGNANAGDEMNLVDNAITSGKYDESTAFPLKADDSGLTEVARTGADADTLKTLSDQIDVVDGKADTISGKVAPLPIDPASETNATANTAAINVNIDSNESLINALGVICSAIDAKTTNLPADPTSEGIATANKAAIIAEVDVNEALLVAIKAVTDLFAFTGSDVHATLDGEGVNVGSIAGSSTVDGKTLTFWSEVLLAMAGGRIKKNTPVQGQVTIYRQDGVTPLIIFNQTDDERTIA